MARFYLSSYTIRQKEKGTNQYLRLDGYDGGLDLFDTFWEYLANRKEDSFVDDDTRKLLRVNKRSRSTTQRILRGIVNVGEFGYEADLHDVTTGTVPYRRTLDDAEMMPFYFLAHLPEKATRGVFILQRRGQRGIRTDLVRDFERYCRENDPGIRIECNPLIPPQLINQFLDDGRLTRIRFIRHTIPSDVVDAYEWSGAREEEGVAELSVTSRGPRGLGLLGRVREVAFGDRRVQDVIELKDFEYDNVKVEIELNGKSKTFDLSDILKIRASNDITEDVALGADGHPVFESIDGIAVDYLRDVLQTLSVG